MRHHLLSSVIMAPSPSLSKPNYHKKPFPSSASSSPGHSHCSSSSSSSSSLLCRHSPSATLDILILILVLFSGTFLVTSYFSYIFQSLSLILPSLLLSHSASLRGAPIFFLLGFVCFFVVTVIALQICCGYRSRKCENPRCKGLKKAMEFDLQLQTEDCLRSGTTAVKEVDVLPWKGGSDANPDYECLRAELRKMAPPNGRAVLLFRSKCGCPVAKLEGWGAKRGRRHKRALALNGGGDHRGC